MKETNNYRLGCEETRSTIIGILTGIESDRKEFTPNGDWKDGYLCAIEKMLTIVKDIKF